MPVVKAKVGPKITTFMCDEKIFDSVPVKKEIKATVSGIYITGVRGMRGPLETPQKKKSFMARMREKADSLRKQEAADKKNTGKKK